MPWSETSASLIYLVNEIHPGEADPAKYGTAVAAGIDAPPVLHARTVSAISPGGHARAGSRPRDRAGTDGRRQDVQGSRSATGSTLPYLPSSGTGANCLETQTKVVVADRRLDKERLSSRG